VRRSGYGSDNNLFWLLTDHLGSTAVTLWPGGAKKAELRYKAFGENRYTSNSTPTTYRYTGQREESAIGLYFYRGRWYDAALGRFIQADTIVPDPADPQALNRYSYVLNNPLRYTDPSGDSPWPVMLAAYAVWRLSYEGGTLLTPGADQARRDRIGGGLVTELSDVIEREATARSMAPHLVGAVLRHESAAFERRLLTLWPSMQPGLIANTAEFVQSVLQGDTASIGPGQMQLRRAWELEEMGYVTARRNDFERRQALLGNETSVEYVAGMLQHVSDQLHTLQGFNDLSIENQQGLILIAYNWGWTSNLLEEIEKRSLEGMIEYSRYNNQTLDEYLRWSSGQ
jgi:RHS repeat-associated protein